MNLGAKIEDVMTVGNNVGKDIPEVVTITIDYVMRHGIDSEGIFRKSGAKTTIDYICDLFDAGATVRIEDHTKDEHDGIPF